MSAQSHLNAAVECLSDTSTAAQKGFGMSIFDRFRKPPSPPPPEQAVIVTLDLSLIDMEATDYANSELSELEDRLTEALADAGTGDFWENEFGADEVSSTFTGPDAEQMFAAMEPVLRASSLGRKARVTLQLSSMGGPGPQLRIVARLRPDV